MTFEASDFMARRLAQFRRIGAWLLEKGAKDQICRIAVTIAPKAVTRRSVASWSAPVRLVGSAVATRGELHREKVSPQSCRAASAMRYT